MDWNTSFHEQIRWSHEILLQIYTLSKQLQPYSAVIKRYWLNALFHSRKESEKPGNVLFITLYIQRLKQKSNHHVNK